jgi:2-succinyl-6-hydroxy-2,4-cyclohexadiene-1-carboxylate synthase
VALHGEHDGKGPRLVLVHGFTQTGRCWGPVGEALAHDHEVVRVDAPGHGGSSEIRADLHETAQLLAETAGPALYLGYSMGARMALHVALDRPDVVQGLVVVGGTAGIDDVAERAARRERDRALARQIRSEGVETFLMGWLDQPMFAGLPRWARFEDERRRNTAEGLASSLEFAGTGSQAPRWDDLAQLRVPVLVVAGADDTRYVQLATRLAACSGPNADRALIAGAGHAAHLEQPTRFLEVLRPWLRSFRPRSARGTEGRRGQKD